MGGLGAVPADKGVSVSMDGRSGGAYLYTGVTEEFLYHRTSSTGSAGFSELMRHGSLAVEPLTAATATSVPEKRKIKVIPQ